MYDDFRLLARGAEAVTDEIHFRFHHGKIILCTSLQYEACAQGSEIGNAGDIEKDIFRQHSSEPREDFLRTPALALKVHYVGLHEYGTTIAKDGHSLCGESQIGVLIHAQPEAFRRGLQEISVAG